MAKKKIDWKKRAENAEAALAKVTAKRPTGRRPAPPRTPHGHLIANAVEAIGCTRGELAERVAKKLGVSFNQSRLTTANRKPEDGGSPLTAEQEKAIKDLTEAAKKRGK